MTGSLTFSVAQAQTANGVIGGGLCADRPTWPEASRCFEIPPTSKILDQ